MSRSPKKETFVQAPCSTCLRENRHRVLAQKSISGEEGFERYEILVCGGCDTLSVKRTEVSDLNDGLVVETYFPSPIERAVPNWVYRHLRDTETPASHRYIAGLLIEIYQAVASEHYRLAAMGTRALLEHLMVSMTGDQGSFKSNLDAFEKGGNISRVQRMALETTLELGHAAMHRGFTPRKAELSTTLDILEGICASIFDHPQAAERLAARVPRRELPSKKK